MCCVVQYASESPSTSSLVTLARKIRSFWTDSAARHGRMGRELPRLFREGGLQQIDVVPAAVYLSDYRVANEGCSLEHATSGARSWRLPWQGGGSEGNQPTSARDSVGLTARPRPGRVS